jgi:hypothetical protein
MSDENFYETQAPSSRLRVWALGQMMWGAMLAGAGVLAIGVMLGAIWIVGAFLPEESKQAPSPNSALEIVHHIQVV